MRLILLGLPGAGKGTQAHILADRLGLLHISTGDMFREAAAAGTELGLRAQSYMSKGELVPDEVTIGMLLERIAKDDAEKGIMLDGFPRTIPQAEALDHALEGRGSRIDAVLYIEVPEDQLMARLTGRWTCSSCGAIYHELTSPPRTAGQCDNEGAQLTQRDDDRPETVKARLDTNRAWTEQLATYYETASKLHHIKGTGAPAEITDRLMAAIESVPAATVEA
ncbi:MAG: adenylate kinase [Chloroflexi bacterium]|nr:adenylate kinase [Chloroflexota bacterium]MDA1145453.1 adenylate kinase [Chloroflexota bacterium]